MAYPKDNVLNLFISFLPMFYFSKILGILPLTYTYRRGSKRKRLPRFEYSSPARAFGVLFLFSCLATFLITFRKAVDAFAVFGNHKVNIIQSEFVSGMTLAPAAFNSLLDLYFTGTSGKKLSKIFSTMFKLDEKLTYPLIPRRSGARHVLLRRIAVAQTIVVPVVILIQSVADYYGIMNRKESYSYMITFYVCRLVSFALDQQFMLLLLILRDRFRLVNEVLGDVMISREIKKEQITNLIPSNGATTEESKYKRKILTKRKRTVSAFNISALRLLEARSAHFALTEVADLVNEVYQVPLLASILGLLLDVIAGGYFILDDILSGSSKKFFTFFSSASWVLFGSLRLLQLSWVAWSTSITATDAQKWVLKLREKKTDVAVIEELKIFMEYFPISKVQFNICGLFNLDMTVVQAIAQASTSYLLVLMQFRQIDL